MIRKYIQDLKREFSHYDKKKFSQDALAGLTVTAVALPLALAFGVGSGATAQAGLITAIIAGIVIGALGGSSYQVSGPTGAMTAILIVLAQRYGIQGVLIVELIAGAILIIAGLLKFGRLVSYLPSPVVTGFTSGIALIIIIGQLDNLLGIHTAAADSTALKLFGFFTQNSSISWQPLVIGALVVAIMLLWPKKWGSFFPSSLAALIIATGVNALLSAPAASVGQIPASLFPKDRLDILALPFAQLPNYIVPALSIAALAMIESLLCGTVAGKMKNEPLNADRELVAQGIGNMVLPFFGGVPATAAIARTSVAIKSGGQTRLVSIFHSVGLLAAMFILAPVMSIIPLSGLAGVLLVTAWRMNEWHSIKQIFSRRFKGAMAKFLITMVATVVFDLTQAIIIGVAFAAVLFVVKSANIEIDIQDVDQERLQDDHGVTLEHSLKHVRVAYLSGPLFFGALDKLRSQLKGCQGEGTLILSLRGVPMVDTSCLSALEDLNKEFTACGNTLMLAAVQPKVMRQIERSGLAEVIGAENIFWSADKAIIAAHEQKAALLCGA